MFQRETSGRYATVIRRLTDKEVLMAKGELESREPGKKEEKGKKGAHESPFSQLSPEPRDAQR